MAAFGARRWALSFASQTSGCMVSASSPIRARRVGADTSWRRRCLGEDGAWSIRSLSSRPNVVTRTSRPASMRRTALLIRSSRSARLLTTSSVPSFRRSSACERLLHLCRLHSTPVLLMIAFTCLSPSSLRRWFFVRSINRSYDISGGRPCQLYDRVTPGELINPQSSAGWEGVPARLIGFGNRGSRSGSVCHPRRRSRSRSTYRLLACLLASRRVPIRNGLHPPRQDSARGRELAGRVRDTDH